MYKPFLSFVDAEELSVYVPIVGCSKKCGFCFNPEIVDEKEMDAEKIFGECVKFLPEVKTFIFSGADALGINRAKTVYLANKLRIIDESVKFHVHVGLPTVNIDRALALNLIQPDEVVYTVNNWLNNEGLIGKTIKTKVIYIPTKTEYPKEIDIDIVQGFINEKTLNPKYEKISQPSHDEVMNFAKSIGAKEIITKSNGRELVC